MSIGKTLERATGVSDRLLPAVIGVFGLGAVSFGLWAQLSARPTHAGPVPARIARVAFSETGSEATEAIEDTGQPTVRVALVRAADFRGEGAEALVEFLVTRRGSELGRCYDDEAPHSVLIRLGAKVEVLEADEQARSCLEARLGSWPWPDDARGLISLDLQTALLL